MKKFLQLYVTVLISLLCFTIGRANQVYKLAFNSIDFELIQDIDGRKFINDKTSKSEYGNPLKPCIPLLCKSFALPYGNRVTDVKITYDSPIVFEEDIDLSLNPQIIQLSKQAYESENEEIFPVVGDFSTSFWQGIPLAKVWVTPFQFDEDNKILSFSENINIEFEIEAYDFTSVPLSDLDVLNKELVNLVENTEEVEDIVFSMPISTGNAVQFDYLLITSKELRSSFVPLLEWKHKKGLKPYVMSIEDIAIQYEGKDLQEKIKHCIYDAYLSCGAKYIVFGGDNKIIPVRYCNNLPSDLYYSCFDGNFDWDSNQNGIYGETTDKIIPSPQVYLTRIPIRTSEDVENYITKLIAYERGYNSENWNLSILMAGVRLDKEYNENYGDSEGHADIIYRDAIAPFWSGKRIKFFDTNTDFSEGNQYDVTAENLQSQLSQSPMFVSVATHGKEKSWEMENSTFDYDVNHASELTAPNFSLITTIACTTNAFDTEKGFFYSGDPCLSEAFIRNKENGVIGYLGSSRNGQSNRNPNTLGASETYERNFYKALFSDVPQENNFGKVVAYSKTATYKTVQDLAHSINPIGDSEMPIFTEIPKTFSDITLSLESGEIVFDSGEEDSLISVTTPNDLWGTPLLYRGISFLGEAMAWDKFTICVTKKNFKPLIFNLSLIGNDWHVYCEEPRKDGFESIYLGQLQEINTTLENINKERKAVIDSAIYSNGILTLNSLFLPTDSENRVIVKNIFGDGIFESAVTNSNENFIIGDLPKGVYTVSLLVNNNSISTQKILIK